MNNMPGSGKQTPEKQQQIKELLEAGFDPTTIHRRLKVGRSSIYRMKRCLQQHGTNYMPPELNKKNGRPKVLTPEQELEVRDWLRDPKNRSRYLDDLVWFTHDRFGIVCSTTTMSKLKRKWVRALECEEKGTSPDPQTRSQLLETHPDLPILHSSPSTIPPASLHADGGVVYGAPEALMQATLGAQMDLGGGGGHGAHVGHQALMDEQLQQQIQDEISAATVVQHDVLNPHQHHSSIQGL